MSDKPKWWPDNPYPKSVFPLDRDKYSEIVPDEPTRTALSGMLGREFWNITSNGIWEAVKAELALHRWIPVSEGLPKIYKGPVLDRSKTMWLMSELLGPVIGWYNKLDQRWENSEGTLHIITHYKPITLPKGD